jgi:CDP-glucose 4,6-dehydratase
MNAAFWKNRKVLLTGHTGFKGSWLSLWLQDLGADLSGYSIDVPTDPSLYDAAGVGDGMTSMRGDVRDLASLKSFVDKTDPEIVIHMAAQSLVRRSYADPVGTYDTNIMGTVNLLEAVRNISSVRVVIIVTSDKCYDNKERAQGYREDEPMGGYDPYSSSKGCAELITAAYRDSFFDNAAIDRHETAIASVRAGNVVGGGDWAEDRLVPDIVAAFQGGTLPEVRNPHAVRPWQFVMDPLNGYLTLAESLWKDGPAFAGAWNFGPDDSDAKDVGYIVDRLLRGWGRSAEWRHDESDHPHEATYLKLDSSKAQSALSWSPVLDLTTTLDWIVEWYQRIFSADAAREVTLEQIRRFQQQAVP